jgi:hypothetical protein
MGPLKTLSPQCVERGSRTRYKGEFATAEAGAYWRTTVMIVRWMNGIIELTLCGHGVEWGLWARLCWLEQFIREHGTAGDENGRRFV